MEIPILNQIKFLGIRPLKEGESNPNALKIFRNLHPGEMYYFYDGCDISEERIELKYIISQSLYDLSILGGGTVKNELKINICAIVGENGSRKSSIIDLVLRVINNLAAYILGEYYIAEKSEHLHYIENVFAELYVLIDSYVIHIKCMGETLEVTFCLAQVSDEPAVVDFKPNKGSRFSFTDTISYDSVCPMQKDKIDLLRHFCYTIVTNYSLYSFNPNTYRAECNSIQKENLIRKKGAADGYGVVSYNTMKKNLKDDDNRDIKLIESKSWIKGLFHKNDGYQTPIVIMPMRNIGIIDTNTEIKLAEERLMSLLFEKDNKGNHFYKEINGKLIVESLKISEDQYISNKYSSLVTREEAKLEILPEKVFEEIRTLICDYTKWAFKLDKKRDHYDRVFNYIIHKTFKIFHTYNSFKDVHEYLKSLKSGLNKDSEKIIKEKLDDLWHYNSHITTKLWRSINYLRYDHIDKKKKLVIEDFSHEIDGILKQKESDNFYSPYRYEELLPPPIFKVSFILYNINDCKKKTPIPFETLSSGEKQLVFTVSSFIYHLINIESVGNYGRRTNRSHPIPSEFYKENNYSPIEYKYVNAIFDEVELYFHPDMQRTFIFNLLHGLKQIPFRRIGSLQIMLVTHSPFILSDIPKQNILFLDKQGHRVESNCMHTFGANIHSMLRHSFFLNQGSMGQYAKHLVKEAIDKVNFYSVWKLIHVDGRKREEVIAENARLIDSLHNSYKNRWDLSAEDIEKIMDWEFLENFVDIIEEPIIKMRLQEEINAFKQN